MRIGITLWLFGGVARFKGMFPSVGRAAYRARPSGRVAGRREAAQDELRLTIVGQHAADAFEVRRDQTPA